MPTVNTGDFDINYEVTHDGKGPTLLLVHGFGEQIGAVTYPPEHCKALADKGFRVVRMDNRDAGLSKAVVESDKIQPYNQIDLADDVAAVIDDLGTGPVHLVGASLGGFIVRWVALRHPEKVKTLTVVMSGCGAKEGEPGPKLSDETVAALMEYLERRERAAQIDWHVGAWRWLWGHGYPFPEDWVRDRVSYSFDRAYNPEGNARLLQGSAGSPSLLNEQSQIKTKTLVIHGSEDPCFPPEHAEITVSKIPNVELWMDPKMGHIIHPEQWDEMADRLARHAGI